MAFFQAPHDLAAPASAWTGITVWLVCAASLGAIAFAVAQVRPHANGAKTWFALASAFLVLFVWATLTRGGAALGLSAGMAGLLIGLAWIDVRAYRLPDPMTASLALLGVISVIVLSPSNWLAHAIGGVAGYTFLFAVETGYRTLTGRDGLGRGDAKLLGALGIWTGWADLPLILLIASGAGLIYVAAIGVAKRAAPTRDAALPFGPFLALGGWVAWVEAGRLAAVYPL